MAWLIKRELFLCFLRIPVLLNVCIMIHNTWQSVTINEATVYIERLLPNEKNLNCLGNAEIDSTFIRIAMR